MATRTLLTVEQFAQMPEEEARKYELVGGELIEVATGNPGHNDVRDSVLVLLRSFLGGRKLGRALTETDFRLDAETVRRPDVAVLTVEQWASVDRHAIPIPLAPALVVEVVSPSDTMQALFEKAQSYLVAGVQVVLVVVFEPVREVHVFGRGGARKLLRPGEKFEAPELLPGFSVDVGEFFEQ